ncbi:MAG: hypothetical protein MZW92_13675 [Comamonadaceae bacterium]|nr:hypothetical protein [Comamonadaceae bacterium]
MERRAFRIAQMAAARPRRRARRRAGRDAAPGAQLRPASERGVEAALLPHPLQRHPRLPAARHRPLADLRHAAGPAARRRRRRRTIRSSACRERRTGAEPAADGRRSDAAARAGAGSGCRRASSRRSRCAASRAWTSPRRRRPWAVQKAA